MTSRSTQRRPAVEPLAERLAGDGQAVEVEQRLQLAQHRGDAAGGVQVLHVVRPVGFRSTSTGVVSLSSFEPVEARSDAERGRRSAVRWMMALVEPPMASSTRSAFSNGLAAS